jgi:ketosteroid isomerase-like protein
MAETSSEEEIMIKSSTLRRAFAHFLPLSGVALAIGLAAGWQLRAIDFRAEAAEDLQALGRAQVERFYAGTAGKAPLEHVLGEGFQLIRTDGTRYDRTGYLGNPASLQTYSLEDFRTTRSGDVLTVTFFTTYRGMLEGVAWDVARVPRLAVFGREGGDWKLQAFANLGQGQIANLEAEAPKAVDAWLGAVTSGEVERIRSVLAPEFQIARADGSAYNAADYLASDLPRFAAMPGVSKLVATGHGDYLVARYWLTVDGTIGGQAMEAEAPRLTVFRRSGDTWLVVAHANFATVGK